MIELTRRGDHRGRTTSCKLASLLQVMLDLVRLYRKRIENRRPIEAGFKDQDLGLALALQVGDGGRPDVPDERPATRRQTV